MVEITIRKRPRTDAVITQRKFFKKTAKGKVIKGATQSESAQRPLFISLHQCCGRDTFGTTSHAVSIAAENVPRSKRPNLLYLRRDPSSTPRLRTVILSCPTQMSSFRRCVLSRERTPFISFTCRCASSSDPLPTLLLIRVLAQMDLMESTLFRPPVIILQTVMEEVRHRSLPLYNRLKALLKMDDKQTWVFYNEFRSYVASI